MSRTVPVELGGADCEAEDISVATDDIMFLLLDSSCSERRVRVNKGPRKKKNAFVGVKCLIYFMLFRF